MTPPSLPLPDERLSQRRPAARTASTVDAALDALRQVAVVFCFGLAALLLLAYHAATLAP